MVDNSLTNIRKVGGVRFTADSTESSNKHEENSNELQWEEYCDKKYSFDLYFGILKLSHSYTMIMNVIFHEKPIKLEIILDQQNTNELQLLVNELSQSENRISFQVEIIINPKTISGPFHRKFFLKEITKSEQRSVLVNVRGKILRQGQGTATLRNGVHMKSIITEDKDDED